MSGPPNINRTDVARYFALLQPPLIAERLFKDASFRMEFGLPAREAISFGGPAIAKGELYDAVRKAFAEQGPQSFLASGGETINVIVDGGDIVLSFPISGGGIRTVRPRNLMFLAPSAEVRQAALQQSVHELGPTGPDRSYWLKELQKGPLDDGEMDRFWDEIAASIVPNMHRIDADTRAGILDKTHLVPRSPAYWEALCGPAPGAMDQETWLREVFAPHRRRLIERDPVQGLDLCLAMGLRDDVTPRSLVAHLSHDELWSALERLRPIDDPFSLLSVADLAASLGGEEENFAALAAETVERLCGEKLLRADGVDVYSFLPALVDLILAELRLLPSIAVCPAYWRRICAWTQAALLVRAFQWIKFDGEDFTKSVGNFIDPDAATAQMLDLRQSPLSLPSETSSLCIRAEVLGRLMILRDRETRVGRELPGWKALSDAFREQAKKAPLLSQMPGPLELDRLPFYRFDNLPQWLQEFREDLRRRADELTSAVDDENWNRFVYFSRIFIFDEDILARITNLVASVRFVGSDEERLAALIHLDQLSYLALAQRHVPLAEAILARCCGESGECTEERHVSALVHIGFVATATSEKESVTKERLAKYLRDLAYALPQGPLCRALLCELEILKTLTPIAEWSKFAQVEALCRLGS
jgi:hypothetical protein